VTFTPQPGDVVEVRFNRTDVQRAPWWSARFHVTDICDTRFGVVVVAHSEHDPNVPTVLLPGQDHVLRLAGQVDGQASLFDGGAA
jgi:hypothetical protein